MRYLKALALAAVAAGALMAFIGAGTASATVLCSTTKNPCPAGQGWSTGTFIDFGIPSGQKIKVADTEGGELDGCSESTLKGTIGNAGSSTGTPTFKDIVITIGKCPFVIEFHTGALEFHNPIGSSNGFATADGTTELTINTVLFGSCVYGATSGTTIGALNEGKPATLTLNAVLEKFSGSNFACPETSNWTGTYTLTSPSNTTLSVSSS
jgi:hypothetical protein